jgi:methylmalonyl-CoA mutase cobalamin-binding subunit
MAQLPPGRAPVVLLTTLPDEPHGMGLLMAECLLTLQGARCINLGMQMPILEIVRAAQAHAVDIVALSLSSAFPVRFASPLVRQVRAALPVAVQLWAGGAGAVHLTRIAGVQVLGALTDIAVLLAQRPRA